MTAVICNEENITYQELDQQSKAISHYLLEKGIMPGNIVCLLLNRNIYMIILMLGVLRIGAAYLPIDKEFPDERIKYIMNDSQCKMVITDEEMIRDIGFAGEILNISQLELKGDIQLPEQNVDMGQLAYVLYTSGSTGYPKGVMIEHQALVAFITGISDVLDFAPKKRILAVTTLSFDISILELLVPLTKGMTIVIATEKTVKSVRTLTCYIQTHKVDIIQMTPTRMSLLLTASRHFDWIEGVSEVLIGGEAFPKSLLEKLQSFGHIRIFNLYGPTEATIWVSSCELTNLNHILIGKPFRGSQMYILDEQQRKMDIGMIGELYIGGLQLARGYLKNTKLTAAKFIEGQERLYKTGDIGRMDKNGNFECLGRIDDQVKIRGYLVATNEVTSVLQKYEPIQDAVVVPKKGKHQNIYLCTYYIAKEELEVQKIKTFLKKYLADYMIPEEFVQVEKFPETFNHKIDKKELLKEVGHVKEKEI